jgi:hypothetical protein
MTRWKITPDRWRLAGIVTLLAAFGPGSSPLCTRAYAQASSTTTTTAATTTVTTTTLPIPLALQRATADLEALASYTDALRACHVEALRPAARSNQLEAHCDTIGRIRQRERCLRVLERFRCRGIRAKQDCVARTIVTTSPRLISRGIAQDLRNLLTRRTEGVACMIGPVDGLTTDPIVECPDRKTKPGRFKRFLQLQCSKSDICDALDCTNDALSKIAEAIRSAAGCRREAFSKVARGEVFDEAACSSQAWSACRSVPCSPEPCFAMEALCNETKAFVDGAISGLSEEPHACIVDGFVHCADSDSCTLDRCDGERCVHDATAEGLTCGENENPCKVNVCRKGACTTENRQGDAPCADEGNACTLDVCRDGECEHPVNTMKLGQPCEEGAPCTICKVDETTIHCAERECPEGCMCNAELGCVLENGTGLCPA